MKAMHMKSIIACSAILGTTALLRHTSYAPHSWGCLAFSVWLLFAMSKGWGDMQTVDKNLLAWGWLSVAAFNCFTRADPSFKVSLQTEILLNNGIRLQFCIHSVCFSRQGSDGEK